MRALRDGEEESEAEIRGRREKEEGLGKEVVRRLGNPREGSGEETESRPIEKKSVRVRFLLSSSPVAGTWDSKMKSNPSFLSTFTGSVWCLKLNVDVCRSSLVLSS